MTRDRLMSVNRVFRTYLVSVALTSLPPDTVVKVCRKSIPVEIVLRTEHYCATGRNFCKFTPKPGGRTLMITMRFPSQQPLPEVPMPPQVRSNLQKFRPVGQYTRLYEGRPLQPFVPLGLDSLANIWRAFPSLLFLFSSNEPFW